MKKLIRFLVAVTLLSLPAFAQYSKAATVLWKNPPSSTLTHYPALVIISDASLKTTGNGGSVTSSSGFDIVAFSDATCSTKLNFEIDIWDGTTSGSVSMWVDVPTFRNYSPAPIYICWGNSAVTTDQSAAATMWANANYISVYHFGNTGSVSGTDSAGHNALTAAGAVATGQVGNAVSLTTAQNMPNTTTTASLPSGTAARTIETWFKLGSSINSGDNIIAGYGSNSAPFAFDFYLPTNAFQIWASSTAIGTYTWTKDTNWHFAVATSGTGNASGSGFALYFDGSAKTLTNSGSTMSTATSNVRVNGTPGSGGSATNETVDEFRIASVQQSAAWEATNYANQSSPSTFETVIVGSPATAPYFSSSPDIIPSGHAGNIVLTLTGTGTSWTGGGTTFTVSGVTGVTKVSQSVASTTSATVTVTTSTGTGTLTISDGTYSYPISVSTPAVTVTSATLTGTNTYSLVIAGTNTVWSQETASPLFTASGVSGATLSSITVTSDVAATATLTSTAIGSTTITDNSTGKTTTISVDLAIGFPYSQITMSPYNWRLPGDGTAWAPLGGPYLKFKVTGTTKILVNVDTSNNSVAANNMPSFKTIINDGVPSFLELPPGSTQATLASGLTSGSTYNVVIYFVGAGDTGANQWTANAKALHLNSIQFSTGATISAYPRIYSKNCLVIGDSFIAGYQGVSQGANPVYTVTDPSVTWAHLMGPALGCEIGTVGMGSQGYSHTGENSYPNVLSTWDHYDSTHARSFSPTPDIVINAEGVNDHSVDITSAVSSWLSAARTALPTSSIFLYIPVGGQAADEDGSGGANAAEIRSAFTSFADANTFLIDTGTALISADNWSTTTWFSPNDSIHPGPVGHSVLESYAVRAIQHAVDGASTAKPSPVISIF